jgi:hypothetical protein
MAGLSCWARAHGVAAIKTNTHQRVFRSVVKVSTAVIVCQQTQVVYDWSLLTRMVVICSRAI